MSVRYKQESEVNKNDEGQQLLWDTMLAAAGSTRGIVDVKWLAVADRRSLLYC